MESDASSEIKDADERGPRKIMVVLPISKLKNYKKTKLRESLHFQPTDIFQY
jgi:hypothetical protein